MIRKCTFLVCSLFLLSGEAVDLEQKVELGYNLEKQDLFEKWTESFKKFQALLEDKVAVGNQMLAFFEYYKGLLEDLENYMTELAESSVGDSHVEVKPALDFLKKDSDLLEKVVAKFSEDQVFDEALYEGNKKTFAFGKDAVKMISKEVPVIKSAE